MARRPLFWASLSLGVLVIVAEAILGLATNTASAQTHWPGFLRIIQRHPWQAAGVTLLALLLLLAMTLAVESRRPEGGPSDRQPIKPLSGDPADHVSTRGQHARRSGAASGVGAPERMTMRSGGSPVGGGVADKRGYRYESWWTIWRGVLPVLRGEFDAIQVEPPDFSAEGAEFRLFGRQPAGLDEVHQCKRWHGTSWTVPALEREGLLDPFGRHLGAGIRVVFASGMPSILLTMAEKARSLATRDWVASLNRSEVKAKDELVQAWDVGEPELHDRLTRLHVHVIDEASLRVTVVEHVSALLDGDPEEALLRLSSLILDNLMLRLTGHQLWDFLRKQGLSPRHGHDRVLSERVLELKSRYVDGVMRTRPVNLPALARPETDQIVRALTAPDGPRVVAVTGPPGSGKSTVLAAVCARLADMGIVVGPLRLDAADTAWTAEALGKQPGIGFGGPPTRILTHAAGGDPAVLVIDQLDAVSVLAGKGDAVLDGVREMLAQAQASDELRLLIACRDHDFTYDRRLRQLMFDARPDGSENAPNDPLQVQVGDLDASQVSDALAALGISPASMSPRLQKLLANPFNLSLLAGILTDRHTEAFNLARVRDRHDLLAEYDHRLGPRLQPALGIDGYAKAVHRIARLLSKSGRLSLPITSLADIPDTVDVLLHEGVLVTDGTRLRFFHDEYFDFIFARQHLQAGRTAADLVGGDIQDLLRRGQVAAILALERQNGLPSYIVDLRAVLNPELTRPHLRASVLTWLTDQGQPEDQELELVAELAANQDDSLSGHALRVLWSQSFSQVLQRHGLLAVAADNLRNVHDQGQRTLACVVRGLQPNASAALLCEAARHLPEEASVAMLPVASDPEAAVLWIGAILRCVFISGSTAGAATAALFCTAAETVAALAATTRDTGMSVGSQPTSQHEASNRLDAAISALYAEHGIGVMALSTLATRTPSAAIEAIGTWLSTAARICEVRGGTHIFGSSCPLPHSRTGLDIFQKTATMEPLKFAEVMTQCHVG